MALRARYVLAAMFILGLGASIQFCAQTAGSEKSATDKAKLEKRIAELKAQVTQEEERLAKKKDAAATEYAKLLAADPALQLARAMQKLIDEHRGGLTSEKKTEARAALQKQVRGASKDIIGPILGPVIEDSLTAEIADTLGLGQNINGDAAVKAMIEGKFEGEDFAAAWERTLKGPLSKPLDDLKAELDRVQSQLADIDRAEQQRRAGIPPMMVEVPGGKTRIGIDDKELRNVSERTGYSKTLENVIQAWKATPSHEVVLEPFYIDLKEVVNSWWVAYMQENPGAPKPHPKAWPGGTMPEGWGNRPVTGISFEDARKFARWMGRRLPTEEEWEAAARWSENPQKELRVWPWGDIWDMAQIKCNSDPAVNHPSRKVIPPGLPPMLAVGTFPEGRSKLGIDDLSGNAFELTTSPFRPYKGFKDVIMKGQRVTEGDFREDEVVVRGGDATKKDMLVTTLNRQGIHRDGRSPYVGFRTAASKTRGKDHVADIVADGDLPGWVVEYKELPSDTAAGRRCAELGFNDPSRYASVSSGGWNPAANLPTAVKRITIITRVADDFRDFNHFKQMAKTAPEELLLLGFLHLDVPAVSPALEAGQYLVFWQNERVPTEAPPSAAEAPADGPKGKAPEKPKKPAAAPSKKGLAPDPAALVLVRRGAKERTTVRIESYMPPIVLDQQPTKIAAVPGQPALDCVFAFPTKTAAKKSLVVTIQLKFAPEVIEGFK